MPQAADMLKLEVAAKCRAHVSWRRPLPASQLPRDVVEAMLPQERQRCEDPLLMTFWGERRLLGGVGPALRKGSAGVRGVRVSGPRRAQRFFLVPPSCALCSGNPLLLLSVGARADGARRRADISLRCVAIDIVITFIRA